LIIKELKKKQKEMSVVKEYFKIQRQAETEFGPNAVVLMEIGSFLECYGTDTFGHAKGLASALNMMCTKKNKKLPLSESNPYLVGFPVSSQEKNISVLSNHFTVVWYTQFKEKNQKIRRERTRVITPGTYVPSDDNGYHVCCVYGTEVVVIDTSVGTVELHHAWTKENLRAFKEIYKPVETIVLSSDHGLFEPITFNNGNNYHDQTTQRTCIGRVYTDSDDIPKPFMVPLACLLDFVWSCHPMALKDLKYPQLTRTNRMSLHNNFVSQLDMLQSHRGDGLFGTIQKHARTAMGRRALRAKLLAPLTSMDEINKELDLVEAHLKRGVCGYEALTRVPDMERMLKTLTISASVPSICTFHEGVYAMLELFPNPELHGVFSKVIRDDTFANEYDHNLQALRTQIANLKSALDKELLEPMFNNCKFEDNLICTTKKRAENLKKNFPSKVHIRPLNSTTSCVYTERSEALCAEYARCLENEQTCVSDLIKRWVSEIETTHLRALRDLITKVTVLDGALARAAYAKEHGLVRPDVKSSEGPSWIKAKCLRHPMIPKYVGNDCELGSSSPGLLLYGINGSGKTCHAKSVALNIILAQAGFYVFADRLELVPFTKMFARINCDDDLYTGLSSFTVEMTELRSILRLADDRSMVIGDELCKGTEDLSALGLVASCVRWFHDRDVKFVFATHLHKLPDLDIIQTANVQIKHVRCEHRGGEIVFLRKLAEGQGDAVYGIEVARHLLGVPEIANRAMEIRNGLLGRGGRIKKSQYNKRVVMTECVACHSTADLHTHHLIPQANFDKKTQRKVMNDQDNLVVLCHGCHDKVHRGALSVERADTIQGKKIMVY
jgi:DNA mismatch repair protein MutS